MADRGTARRPRDAALTRAAIVECAQRLFAQLGYPGTTVRAVAAAAGVSPNLITKHFGSKAGLFLAATEPRVNTADPFPGELSTLGHRLADSIVTRWEAVGAEDPLVILLRAAGSHPEAAAALSDFVGRQATEPLRRHLRSCGCSTEEAEDRATAAEALIMGTVMTHRILPQTTGGADGRPLRIWLAQALQALIDGGGASADRPTETSAATPRRR